MKIKTKKSLLVTIITFSLILTTHSRLNITMNEIFDEIEKNITTGTEDTNFATIEKTPSAENILNKLQNLNLSEKNELLRKIYHINAAVYNPDTKSLFIYNRKRNYYKLLVLSGANPKINVYDGQTLLAIAQSEDDQELIEFLRKEIESRRFRTSSSLHPVLMVDNFNKFFL